MVLLMMTCVLQYGILRAGYSNADLRLAVAEGVWPPARHIASTGKLLLHLILYYFGSQNV